MSARALVCLCCLFASGLAFAEPFSAEHLVRLDRVGAPAVSPSGDLVVFTVRKTDMEAGKGRYDLWLTDLSGSSPRPLTSHEANDTSPAWSPDGKSVYFLSSRSGSSQVWRIAITGGEAQPVTSLPLDVGSFKLSPSAERLVLSTSVYLDCTDLQCTADRDKRQAASKVSAQAYDQLFMRHWDHWLDEKRSQLFALPLSAAGTATGSPIRISTVDADVPSRIWGGSEEYAVSADDRTIYFAARIRDADEPTSTNFDIYAAPLNGDGPARNLTADNEAWDTMPVLSPDGRSLAYVAMARAGFEADQLKVMLRDLQSGETRVLSADWDYSPSSMAFTPDGSALVMNAQDVGHKTLWRLDVATGAVQRIRDGAYISAFDLTADRIVYAQDSLTSPSELFVADAHGKDPVQLTHVSQASLGDVALGDYEQFSFTGAEDDEVYGFVVKPADFDPQETYPVAFVIHGGPQGSSSNHWHYRWNPQTYAGAGFAVVMIDFHGSTGYGQAFTDSITGDWGGKPLVDLKLGLAAALQRYSFLDGDRVCALGASYGGYMINWIAGNWPDRFRCLVNHDGIFDQQSMYYTTEELWFPEWEQGGPYHERAKAHERFNPANFVDQWQTPMLVIHGELDYRVPVTQGIAAFTALQRRGIESRFLYFPDENHWVLKPHNSIRWHEEVNGWLKRHLDADAIARAEEAEAQLVARALEIHDRVLTLDTHADTPLRMIEPGFDMAVRHDPKESGSKVDYPRMKEGGLDAIFFAAFVAQDIRDDDGHGRAKALGLQMIDAVVDSTAANADAVGLALNPEDAYALERAGKRAIYLGLENGYPVGDDLSNVELFFDKGVRYITLVHSSNNDLADSATDEKGPEHGGLSPLGEEVVREMNRLGIMVDVSHGSDEVFYDAIAVSKAPIIASHSNARAVTDHQRNMSDDMLRAMAENGGVVQLTMLSTFLRDMPENPQREAAMAELRASMKMASEMTQQERDALRAAFNELNEKYPQPAANVAHAVNHIDHIVRVAGIDHVGIGCDFDGGGGIEGVFDASEVMNITIELVRRGYTQAQIEKIWGGNLMRVFREVQAVAQTLQAQAATP